MLRKVCLFVLFFCAPVAILRAESLPEIGIQEKKLAISFVEEYEGVLDATIRQSGRTIFLAITMDYGTDETSAKQIGANFVRLVKTFSGDTSPGRTIGKGFYDYEVEVHLPDNSRIARGAKVDFARQISWLLSP